MLTALVVDDEPRAVDRLVTMLEESGCVEVIGTAGSVDDAERFLAGRRRDCVFLDIDMPGPRNRLGASWLPGGCREVRLLIDGDREVVIRLAALRSRVWQSRDQTLLVFTAAAEPLPIGRADPSPVFVPVLMRELGNRPRGLSEEGPRRATGAAGRALTKTRPRPAGPWPTIDIHTFRPLPDARHGRAMAMAQGRQPPSWSRADCR